MKYPTRRAFCKASALAASASASKNLHADRSLDRALLDKDAQLRRFRFWQNQDWAWYRDNIPFFESPEPQLDETYYYRWEVVTRHLRYTSPDYGYIATEFLVDKSNTWAGRYQAISAAADLHIDELRWMKTTRPARDYIRYFLTVPGAKPRAYGFAPAWVADSLSRVHGGESVLRGLLPQCVANYQGWETGRVAYPNDNGFDFETGLFWNTGRDMGSEFNLASAQLSDQLRGIPGYKIRGGAGYRPDINAALYGEAKAIAALAHSLGDSATAGVFVKKAAAIKQNVQTKLWDPKREFFMHRWRYDEYAEGDEPGYKSIKAGTLLWDTNGHRDGGIGFQPERKGIGKGRELFCYHLWRYGLPDDNDESSPETGYARAWRFLASPEHFAGVHGPRTGEREDPWYSVIYGECRHNGQTWPYHTSRVLAGGAILLNEYNHHDSFSRADWFSILLNYARLHRNANQPFIAESHDPDRPQWTELRPPGFHYFHSSFIDLVITGVAGLRPRHDEVLELNPLAPAAWDYFALDDLLYHGRRVSIIWDRHGEQYGQGRGLQVFAEGKRIAQTETLRKLEIPFLSAAPVEVSSARESNYAVNAEDLHFPLAEASFSNPQEPPGNAINGSCWFDTQPPNRWTSRGSKAPTEWFAVNFESSRTLHRVSLFFYEDDYGIAAPAEVRIEYWRYAAWQAIQPVGLDPELRARCATHILFEPVSTDRIRAVMTVRPGFGCGLAQFEAWGPPQARAVTSTKQNR